jgi:hypothetical protein
MSPQSDPGLRASRADGFVHVRLTGPIAARAYSFGNAVRLGNVTLVVGDAEAARSIALLALLLQDAALRLGPTYVGRRVDELAATEVTALVSLHGAQRLSDFRLTPAGAVHNWCGEASVTSGSVRFTFKDRTAAEAAARALELAYEDARHHYAGLLEFAEFKAARDRHRQMNKKRRGLPV